MTLTKQLETVFQQAFLSAIQKVGLGVFLSTSMFASNHKAGCEKKAA